MTPYCIRSTELLLLPGMMCDERLWSQQVAALAADCRVHCGDLTRDNSITAIAERVLDAAPPRFALAGLSMGGIVALEIMRSAPERVERLALLDTNFRADNPERKVQRNRQLTELETLGLEQLVREELLPAYLADGHPDTQHILNEVLDMGLRLGDEVFVRQSIALRDRLDSSSVLAGIDCPTLVLCGEQDRLCSVELHREMAEKISGSRLQVIPHCGHLATMEQPGRVIAEMRHWLYND